MKTDSPPSRRKRGLPVLRVLFGIVIMGVVPGLASAADAALVTFLRSDGHAVAVDPAIPPYVPGPLLSGDLHLVGGGGIATTWKI